jgi:peptide/nickel transport system substrate-binding protein
MLVAAAEIDPIGLDPHNSSNFSSAQAYDHIYESLTTYDEKTNIVPCLATSWEITNGGKTYTFKLRPNVKFHNGQTMTAKDVVASMKQYVGNKASRGLLAQADQEVKIIDPLTVQMNLDARIRSSARSRNQRRIIKGLAEQENLKIKGSDGPFKLVRPGDRIVYARHTDYWDKSLPYLDEMTSKC